MNILQTFKQLRDDLKAWATVNFKALNEKIDKKTIDVDSKLDSTSTNAVQNKVVANAISNIPKFSGDYNDLINAPDIFEDESGDLAIADQEGNIIFKADADGIHTTALSLNGDSAATETYVDNAIANIDIPEVDFTGYATEAYVDNAVGSIEIPEVDFTGYATETYVDNKVADLVNSAPEALNTLGELAAALENHEDAYDALLETVGGKATPKDLENLKTELSESIVAESEEWKVVDDAGNIIFSVDASGAHTTALTLNGETVTDIIDGKVVSLVDGAPDTLNTLNKLATEIGKKVDKEAGKGLSTNDFTDDYKDALDNLGNMQFDETDPTVPAWAKAENKPSYTADEVGALSDTTVLADLSEDSEHRTVSDTEKSVWNAKSNFSGNYNDLLDAPDIQEDDAGNLIIADGDGNIIFRSDVNGFETTTLSAQNIILNGTAVEDVIQSKIQSYVDEAILGGAW